MQIQINAKEHCARVEDRLNAVRQELQSIAQSGSSTDRVVQPFLTCMELRRLMRTTVDELDMRHRIVELQKQKIEKSKSYLQSLQYYKSMLATKIQVCDVRVDSVEDILECDMKPENWVDGFRETTGKLKIWIDDAKQQKTELAAKKEQKETIEYGFKKKKKLHTEELPSYLSKFQDNLKTVMSVFEIPTTYLLSPVKNTHLVNLYSYFLPLFEAKIIKIESQDDSLSLVVTPPTDHPTIKQAATIAKIHLETKEVRLNFEVLPGNRIVIAVDRSCEFNNEEMLNCIINDEPIKPIFAHPQNEQQRNANNRFVQFDWLNSLVNTHGNVNLSCDKFIEAFIQRSLSIQLCRHLLECLKSNKLPFYFRMVDEHEYSNLHLKKQHLGLFRLTVTNLTKLSYEELKPHCRLPQWVNSTNQNIIIGLAPQLDVLEYYSQKYEYFKVAITYQNKNIEIVLSIPASYPNKKTHIKVIQYCDKKEKRSTNRPNSQLLYRINSARADEIHPMDLLRIEKLQRLVNRPFDDLTDKCSPSLYFLLQLNRFLSLLDDLSYRQLHHQSHPRHYQV